eukprot:Clim_evm40s197 gene=Clim_evmTU40s197
MPPQTRLTNEFSETGGMRETQTSTDKKITGIGKKFARKLSSAMSKAPENNGAGTRRGSIVSESEASWTPRSFSNDSGDTVSNLSLASSGSSSSIAFLEHFKGRKINGRCNSPRLRRTSSPVESFNTSDIRRMSEPVRQTAVKPTLQAAGKPHLRTVFHSRIMYAMVSMSTETSKVERWALKNEKTEVVNGKEIAHIRFRAGEAIFRVPCEVHESLEAEVILGFDFLVTQGKTHGIRTASTKQIVMRDNKKPLALMPYTRKSSMKRVSFNRTVQVMSMPEIPVQ